MAKAVTSLERALTSLASSHTVNEDAGGIAMADNLALKLLVAGIIGAVVGAAAADRYRLPSGLMYGFNRPWTTTSRGAPDSVRPGERYDDYYRRWSSPPDWPDWGPSQRWRQVRPGPSPRIAMCWREYEDWNFGTRGRWVRCPPGVGGRDYGPRRDGR